MSGLYRFLTGYYEVLCPHSRAAKVINAVIRANIRHGGFSLTQKGELTFSVGRKDAAQLREIIDKSGVVGYSLYRRGLPFLLYGYRRRIGFAAGAAIFLAAAYISTLFVWRVDVISDTELNKTEVVRNLSELGLSVGCFIPDCDFRAISSEYAERYGDCAWISVNPSGTVAEVELAEMIPRPASAEEAPCNIVAAYGGVIDSFVISSGKGYIAGGDLVKKGDILVSGVIEDIQGAVRLTGARAEVYAEVERAVTVSVPLAYSERMPTGAEKRSRTLKILGAEFPIPFGSSDPGEGWELSREEGSVTLPDGKPLPVTLCTEIWREYREVEMKRTEAEALALARRELARAVADQLAGARILEITEDFRMDGEKAVGEARVRCICNIAERRDIVLKDEVAEDRGD